MPVLLLLAACSHDDPNAPEAHLDFARSQFYDAPFPNADLFGEENAPDLSAFPNPNGIALIDKGLRQIEHDAHGASLAAAIFFTLSKSLDDSDIPGFEDTLTADALTQLVNLDTGDRIPLRVQFQPDGGPFGAPNLLVLLPLQGINMLPDTTYAAVLRKDVDGVST